MFKIPSSFKLGGRTWQVKVAKYIDEDEPTLLGKCSIDKALISIKEGAPEIMKHTFCHELGHALCYTLGWRKLNKNEEDIDAMGNLLLQFLESKRGTIYLGCTSVSSSDKDSSPGISDS